MRSMARMILGINYTTRYEIRKTLLKPEMILKITTIIIYPGVGSGMTVKDRDGFLNNYYNQI